MLGAFPAFSIHIPVLQRGELSPPGAPCLCETAGATTLAELGPDPRLVGLISPANVVEALWSEMFPSAREVFDLIDVDASESIAPNNVRV